jgi:hypothetical protein
MYIQYIQGLFQSRLGTADYALVSPSSLCYHGSLDTWRVVHMTTAKFKPHIFSVSGFALSNVANIFMILDDFCLLPAWFCYVIINARNFVVLTTRYIASARTAQTTSFLNVLYSCERECCGDCLANSVAHTATTLLQLAGVAHQRVYVTVYCRQLIFCRWSAISVHARAMKLVTTVISLTVTPFGEVVLRTS